MERSMSIETRNWTNGAGPSWRAGRNPSEGRQEINLTILDPKGEPENPGSETDVYDKFRMLAGTVIKADRVEKVLEKIDGLEKMRDLSELTSLLVGK